MNELKKLNLLTYRLKTLVIRLLILKAEFTTIKIKWNLIQRIALHHKTLENNINIYTFEKLYQNKPNKKNITRPIYIEKNNKKGQ